MSYKFRIKAMKEVIYLKIKLFEKMIGLNLDPEKVTPYDINDAALCIDSYSRNRSLILFNHSCDANVFARVYSKIKTDAIMASNKSEIYKLEGRPNVKEMNLLIFFGEYPSENEFDEAMRIHESLEANQLVAVYCHSQLMGGGSL